MIKTIHNLPIGVLICNFEKWEKQLRKGLSDVDRQKFAKKKFLFSNVQSLKETSTKMSGLMMFSEIGKLRARKKIPSLEPKSVFKDYDVHSVTFWLTRSSRKL